MNIEIKKWQKKTLGQLKLLSVENNYATFECDGAMFMVNYDNMNIQPIHGINKKTILHINKYIYNKKPNLSRLLLHIEKKFKTDNRESVDNNYNTFNFESQMLRRRLENNLQNAKSTLCIDKKCSVAKLYGDTEPGLILIEEFMRMYHSSNSNKVIISVVDDNIYHWNVKFREFNNRKLMKQLEQLNKSYGYDYIEIEIQLHDKLYPMYPPVVTVVRPVLENKLMLIIPTIKFLQLDYWNPTKGLKYAIKKIQELLLKHCVICPESDKNDPQYFPDGAYYQLEKKILTLTSLANIRCDNVDDSDIKKYLKNNIQNNNNRDTPWKSGTGYSTSSSKDKWSIKKYAELQKEKNAEINNALLGVIDDLQNSTDDKILSIIRGSNIVTFIKNYLYGFSFLDAENHNDIYFNIFRLLQNFTTEALIEIYDIVVDNTTIFSILTELNIQAKKLLLINNNDKSNFVQIITSLYEMVNTIHTEKGKLIELNKKKYNSIYEEKLCDERFDTADIINSKYYYSSRVGKDVFRKKFAKRVSSEYASLMQSLPISYDASIFFRADENNLSVCRVLITGPHGTPYDSGCYIFDIHLNSNYPTKCPSVWFINHHGKRFNPNLYNTGKVCLSLLGTWSGHQGEMWNSETSTLYQIFLSIQSLILIEEPYFNEPGYERQIGSMHGNTQNKKYNDIIRLYTMKYSILDLLENNNYPEFKEIIKTHFSLKKDRILKVCCRWKDEAITNKNEYEKTYKKITELLQNL